MSRSESFSPIILALTGASGAAYGLRLLEVLLKAQRPVYLLVSKAAQLVLAMETPLEVPARPAEMQRFFCDRFGVDTGLLTVFSREDWTAPIASGSHRARPLSLIHLDNMQRLAQAGAIIMPANPGFYHQPQSVQDLVDFMVARILDHLGIEHGLLPRWGEVPTGEAS